MLPYSIRSMIVAMRGPYHFESLRNRIQWYARQLLPLRYSWEGEIRMPGEARWTPARCEWRMWLGKVLWVDWQYTEN